MKRELCSTVTHSIDPHFSEEATSIVSAAREKRGAAATLTFGAARIELFWFQTSSSPSEEERKVEEKERMHLLRIGSSREGGKSSSFRPLLLSLFRWPYFLPFLFVDANFSSG